MNKKNIILGIVALALVIAGVAVIQRSGVLGASGATHYQKESFLEGAFFGNSRQVNIDRSGNISTEGDVTVSDDLTVSGGVFTLTTSNSATSTAIMGCIQTYATSTATAWRLGIGSIATSSPLYSGGTGTNFLLAQYGTCPF